MIRLHRVYDTAQAGHEPRFLVERLWPRGLKKRDLPVDGWLKEAAPSTALRKWFNHDPARWEAFRERYFRELEARPEAWRALLDAAGRGDVTLLYSSRDTEHNNALALREFLTAKLKGNAAAARKQAA